MRRWRSSPFCLFVSRPMGENLLSRMKICNGKRSLMVGGGDGTGLFSVFYFPFLITSGGEERERDGGNCQCSNAKEKMNSK